MRTTPPPAGTKPKSYGQHARYRNPKGVPVNFPPNSSRRRPSAGRFSIHLRRLGGVPREPVTGSRRTIKRQRMRRDARGRFT